MTEAMGFPRGGFGPCFARRHGYRVHAQQFTGREVLYSRAGYSRPEFARTGVLAYGEALSRPSRCDGLAHAGFPVSVTPPRFAASGCGSERRGVIRSRFRGRLTVGPATPTRVVGADCLVKEVPMTPNRTASKTVASHHRLQTEATNSTVLNRKCDSRVKRQLASRLHRELSYRAFGPASLITDDAEQSWSVRIGHGRRKGFGGRGL